MTATMPPDTLAGYTDADIMTFCDQAVATGNDTWLAILTEEAARRDQADAERRDREERSAAVTAKTAEVRRKLRAKRRASGDQAAWYEAAHAQFLAAEAACAGRLLSPEGMKATSQPMTLWTGAETWARRLASLELNNWWDVNGRLTFTQYRRQAAASRLEQREGYRNDQLGRHEAVAVSAAAAEAEATAAGGPVRAAGSGDDALPAARAGAGTGAGGPVPARSHDDAGPDRRGVVPGMPGRVPAGPVLVPVLPGEGIDVGIGDMIVRGAIHAGEDAAKAARTRTAADIKRRTDELKAGRPDPGAAVAVRQPSVVAAEREPVDGDQVLRYVYTFLKRFAMWGSEAELITGTLWIAQTYARDGNGVPVWQYCARLGIFGPSGSGKSWKSRLIGKLCSNGEILVEPTKPAFIDLCADNNTVVITEADEAFRSPGRSRGIVAVINAAYEPDRSSSRKQGGVAVKIPLFCHVILDGIDDVMLSPNRPDLRPLISRCIVLLARRAPEGYRPPRFDSQARAIAAQLGQRCGAWMAQEVIDGLADEVPDVPEHLGNRPFALWEPLFIVAQRADKGLREKARQAGEDDPGTPWSDACADACEQFESVGDYAEQTPEDMSELDRQMAAWSGFALEGDDE